MMKNVLATILEEKGISSVKFNDACDAKNITAVSIVDNIIDSLDNLPAGDETSERCVRVMQKSLIHSIRIMPPNAEPYYAISRIDKALNLVLESSTGEAIGDAICQQIAATM